MCIYLYIHTYTYTHSIAYYETVGCARPQLVSMTCAADVADVDPVFKGRARTVGPESCAG